MKKERRIIVLSIAINSITTMIKMVAGLVFGSFTLMVSGYNTLCNIVLDFMAFIGSITRGRRANRLEPFGYGKKEVFANIFLAVIISCLGFFIMVKSFFLDYDNTNIKILFVLLLLVLAIFIFSNYLFRNAKAIQSNMLMDMAHVSYFDAIITLCVIFVAFLSNIMPVFDFMGSLFLGAILIFKGLNILTSNYIALKGENILSKRVVNKIRKIIKDGDGITFSHCTLVRIKKHYKAEVEILLDDDVSLHDLIVWEEYLKGEIKMAKIDVSFVRFLVYKS